MHRREGLHSQINGTRQEKERKERTYQSLEERKLKSKRSTKIHAAQLRDSLDLSSTCIIHRSQETSQTRFAEGVLKREEMSIRCFILRSTTLTGPMFLCSSWAKQIFAFGYFSNSARIKSNGNGHSCSIRTMPI